MTATPQTIKMDDSGEVVVIDIRMPCMASAVLANHEAAVNGLAWAPHSSCHISTAADDRKALIWDIQNIPKTTATPILAYEAAGPINQIQWSSAHNSWIAITYDQTLEILRL